MADVRRLVAVARQLHEKGIDAMPRVMGPFLTLRVPTHQANQVQHHLQAWA